MKTSSRTKRLVVSLPQLSHLTVKMPPKLTKRGKKLRDKMVDEIVASLLGFKEKHNL